MVQQDGDRPETDHWRNETDMKLDRNANPDGRGKYALVHLRRVRPGSVVVDAIELLRREGVLTFGNESPGSQFFVMKHKDKFTAGGLRGYAEAINQEYLRLMQDEGMIARMVKVMDGEQLSKEDTIASQEQHTRLRDLVEYRNEILTEARRASRVDNRMPD